MVSRPQSVNPARTIRRSRLSSSAPSASRGFRASMISQLSVEAMRARIVSSRQVGREKAGSPEVADA